MTLIEDWTARPSPNARPLAREAARKSIVMLKNKNSVLPLQLGAKVALIGPFARENQHLNGTWAIFSDNADSVNLYEGLVERLGADAVSTTPGCGIRDANSAELAAAVALARSADIAVLAIGESQTMSGESRSRADVSLPPAQLELARALKATGTPLVVLLRNGRPLVLNELAELSDALMVTWYLGSEMGRAVADVLMGDEGPSGRLPMSFPRHAGQIPIYYNRKSTGRPPFDQTSRFRARYIDVDPGPLFPFGYGLGYGAVEYGPTEVSTADLVADGQIEVQCALRETAGARTVETAQLYIHDLAASRVRPVRELKGFQKLDLASHGRQVVRFTLTARDLAFLRADGRFDAEPGAFEVWIAAHAEGGIPARFNLLAPADVDAVRVATSAGG